MHTSKGLTLSIRFGTLNADLKVADVLLCVAISITNGEHMDVRASLGNAGIEKGVVARAMGLRLLIAGLALLVTMLALPSRASADTVTISLQENGGAITKVASGSGSATYVGDFGDYFLNTVTGVGSPTLVEPGLQSSTIDISGITSGTDTLNIFVTELGLTSPTGVNSFASTFVSDGFLGGITSLTEQTFIGDPGTGTLLSSYTFTDAGIQTLVNNTPNLGSKYDETLEYTIKTSGIGGLAGSIAIAAAAPVNTPEPSTLLLLGLSLGGLFLVGRKRRTVLA